MAEDLALHQIVGNGGAVERDEGLIPARAALVDRLGTDLLAGAALPVMKTVALLGAALSMMR